MRRGPQGQGRQGDGLRRTQPLSKGTLSLSARPARNILKKDTIIIAYRIYSILRNISEKVLKYFHCKYNIKSYILTIDIKNAIVHKRPAKGPGSENARPIPVMCAAHCHFLAHFRIRAPLRMFHRLCSPGVTFIGKVQNWRPITAVLDLQ